MTLFDTIFDQFFLIVDDRRFLDNLTPDVLASTLSRYLDRARAIFGDYCYKDLNDYTATENETYSFIGDNNTTEFVLSPSPPTDCEFYVSIDSVETEDYIFDSGTDTITISATPTLNSDIYIGAYKTGNFTTNLNIKEITFLARGMTIPWLEFMLQKKKHLDQIVYGKNMAVHSQANHNQINEQVLEKRLEKLEQDIMYYTYKQNDDNLDGINGGKSLSSEVT